MLDTNVVDELVADTELVGWDTIVGIVCSTLTVNGTK